MKTIFSMPTVGTRHRDKERFYGHEYHGHTRRDHGGYRKSRGRRFTQRHDSHSDDESCW